MTYQRLVSKNIAVTFLLLTFGAAAQAGPLAVHYSRSLGAVEESKLETELEKAYQFVTNKIPDIIDRQRNPITVRFKNLDGLVGFTPVRKGLNSDEVDIDLSLEGDWRAQIVLAHELVHVFRHRYNQDEVLWLDEGLAKLMETLYIGYWPKEVETRLKDLKEVTLSSDPQDYQPKGRGYTTAYFFIQYLYARLGGDDFLKKVVQSKYTGWDNLEKVAPELLAENKTFIPARFLTRKTLWEHFAFALLLNDPWLADYGLFLVNYNYEALINCQSNNLLSTGGAPSLDYLPWTIHFFKLPIGAPVPANMARLLKDSRQIFYLLEKQGDADPIITRLTDEDDLKIESLGKGQRYLIEISM